ncbi:MAG: hypothetical protein WCJ07_12045 [Verrucomicrobiota bacterium]
MKIPREILLAQHRATEPSLDNIRRTVVANELGHQNSKAQSWMASFWAAFRKVPNTLWRELIFPCRRIGVGLAAIWMAITAINISLGDHSTAPVGKSSSPVKIMAFRDRRELLNILLDDRSAPLTADPPRILSPKPRTEITETKIA